MRLQSFVNLFEMMCDLLEIVVTGNWVDVLDDWIGDLDLLRGC